MYAGQIVESSPVQQLYATPCHPYTYGLLQSVPLPGKPENKLHTIEGQPPDLIAPSSGCAFIPRCQFAMEVCLEAPPLLSVSPEHQVRCWLNHPDSPRSPRDLFTAGGQV